MRTIYTDPQGEKHYTRPKSLVIDNRMYTPPTDEQLTSAGWTITEEIDTIPEPYVPTLEELVEQKIRTRYSINQEFQVNRKRDTDPEGFAAYNAFVEQCIREAEQEPHRVAEEGE